MGSPVPVTAVMRTLRDRINSCISQFKRPNHPAHVHPRPPPAAKAYSASGGYSPPLPRLPGLPVATLTTTVRLSTVTRPGSATRSTSNWPRHVVGPERNPAAWDRTCSARDGCERIIVGGKSPGRSPSIQRGRDQTSCWDGTAPSRSRYRWGTVAAPGLSERKPTDGFSWLQAG